jgi:hypothetical protein
VASLLADPLRAAEIGAAGRRLAESRYSVRYLASLLAPNAAARAEQEVDL